MRKVAYVIYIVSVLLISGFSRAHAEALLPEMEQLAPSPIRAESYDFDASTMNLYVSGYLPNPCYKNPSAIAVMDETSPDTVILSLTATQPKADIWCIDRIESFSTVLSLPQIILASNIVLEVDKIYVIRTQDRQFQTKFTTANLVK